MGAEDDMNSALAHLALSLLCGYRGVHLNSRCYSSPGLHGNFFLHGVVGFINFSGLAGGDFSQAYTVSYVATRYLAIPCLMGDLYRPTDCNISLIHVISGLVPFALFLTGNKNVQHMGNVILVCNIISLCYYSHKENRQWGFYTAAASVFAYFMAPQAGTKILYPLSLALVEYCAFRLSHIPTVGPSA